MIDRLPLQRIVIPTVAYQAADIVITAIREAGVDPQKAARHQMSIECVREWSDGKLERPDACQHCEKVGRVDGHRPDYSQQDLIVWLCRRCHQKSHHSPEFEREVAAKAHHIGAAKKASSSALPGPTVLLPEVSR